MRFKSHIPGDRVAVPSAPGLGWPEQPLAGFPGGVRTRGRDLPRGMPGPGVRPCPGKLAGVDAARRPGLKEAGERAGA